MIELLNLVFGPQVIVHGLPLRGDAFQLQQGADVILLEHAHGSACLAQCEVNVVLLEDFHKDGGRSQAAVIDGGACPIENEGFHRADVGTAHDEIHVPSSSTTQQACGKKVTVWVCPTCGNSNWRSLKTSMVTVAPPRSICTRAVEPRKFTLSTRPVRLL